MAVTTRKPRSQPYRFDWPLTQTQWENLDATIQIIFDELKRASDRLDAIEARLTAGGL